MISGIAVVPKPTASATVLTSFRFDLLDRNPVEGDLYRWEKRDFTFEQGTSTDGWFLTISVSFANASHHLHQHDSTFFTNRATGGLKAQLQSWIKPPDKSRPLWKRRSDRWWPVKDGSPLHFIGQFVAGGYAGYLFSDVAAVPLIAAYVDDLGTQDLEDHYDDEAKRDA
jgi:hypothetical protein